VISNNTSQDNNSPAKTVRINHDWICIVFFHNETNKLHYFEITNYFFFYVYIFFSKWHLLLFYEFMYKLKVIWSNLNEITVLLFYFTN
jgi:hypothetical protein